MTPIAQEDVHRALMARVEALTLTPAPVVVWPGFPASQAAYWLRVTHLPNIPTRRGLNDTTNITHQGILQIDLMNDPGQHEVVYIARAQDVIDHFPQDLALVQGTARVLIRQAYALGGRATGDHWMTPVRVEYAVSRAT